MSKKHQVLIEDNTDLQRLIMLTKRDSVAEVVRDALTVYNKLATDVVNGKHIYVGKDISNVSQLAITSFEHFETK